MGTSKELVLRATSTAEVLDGVLTIVGSLLVLAAIGYGIALLRRRTRAAEGPDVELDEDGGDPSGLGD